MGAAFLVQKRYHLLERPLLAEVGELQHGRLGDVLKAHGLSGRHPRPQDRGLTHLVHEPIGREALDHLKVDDAGDAVPVDLNQLAKVLFGQGNGLDRRRLSPLCEDPQIGETALIPQRQKPDVRTGKLPLLFDVLRIGTTIELRAQMCFRRSDPQRQDRAESLDVGLIDAGDGGLLSLRVEPEEPTPGHQVRIRQKLDRHTVGQFRLDGGQRHRIGLRLVDWLGGQHRAGDGPVRLRDAELLQFAGCLKGHVTVTEEDVGTEAGRQQRLLISQQYGLGLRRRFAGDKIDGMLLEPTPLRVREVGF